MTAILVPEADTHAQECQSSTGGRERSWPETPETVTHGEIGGRRAPEDTFGVGLGWST